MDDNFIQLYTLAIHECILVLHSFGTRSTEAIWTEGYLQHVAALLQDNTLEDMVYQRTTQQ